MAYNPIDPTLGGPLPPPDPRDPTPRGIQPPVERDQDPFREGYEESLTDGSSRPLTDDEKDAARDDPGRPGRTYAPASERVPAEPSAVDRKLVEEGKGSDAPSSGASAHPGDRSDPSELR